MIQTDTGLLNLLPETVYINQVTNKISPKNCHIHNKENRFQIASINLALTDRLIVHHFISYWFSYYLLVVWYSYHSKKEKEVN